METKPNRKVPRGGKERVDAKLNIPVVDGRKMLRLLKPLMRIHVHILAWLPILFVLMLFIEILHTQVIVRPIEVPKSIRAKGYTAEVVGQHLIDKMNMVKTSSSPYWPSLRGSWSEDDLIVPIIGVSIKSTAEYLLDWLPLGKTVISGEILLSENKDKFSLVLRINGKTLEKCGETREYEHKKIDEMMMDGVRCVFEILAPHELASYYFVMDRSRPGHKVLDEYNESREKITDLLFVAMHWDLPLDVDAKTDAHILYGDLYYREKHYDDAIRHYKEAIKNNPDKSEAYSHWALTLEHMGKFQQALEKHRKAIDVDPDDHNAYTEFANALLRARVFDCTSEYYERAITLDPNYSRVYVGKGRLMLLMKEYEEAIENYKKATLINPKSVSAYAGWGAVLVAQEKFESAIAKFKKAIEIDPTNLRPYFGLFYAFDRAGMDDEKSEIYKNILRLQLEDRDRTRSPDTLRPNYKLEAFLDCWGSRVEPLPEPWYP